MSKLQPTNAANLSGGYATVSQRMRLIRHTQ